MTPRLEDARRLANSFIGTVASDASESRVDPLNDPLRISNDYAFSCRFQGFLEEPQLFVLLLDVLLRKDLLSHVGGHT